MQMKSLSGSASLQEISLYLYVTVDVRGTALNEYQDGKLSFPSCLFYDDLRPI